MRVSPLCFCILASGVFTLAGAQTTPPPLALDPVEVTGTRLGRRLEDSPINYTLVSREALQDSGRLRLGEVLRELPEFGGSQITDLVAFNETRGVTAFDLRGLGSGNTLILVNGRRPTVNASVFNAITTFVDLNRFPPSSVERVEILKSGAAAIYGADAVGGVVNLITRRQPAGGEVSVSYGNTFRTDAAELNAVVIVGATRGRLGLSVGIDWFQRHAQAHVDRDFTRTADLTARFIGTYDYYARLTIAERAHLDGRSLTSGQARFSVAPGAVNGRDGVSVPGLPTGAAVTTLPGTNGLISATPNFTSPSASPTGGQFNATAAATFVAPELTRGDPAARNLFDFNRYIWTTPAASRLGATVRADYETTNATTLFAEFAGGRNRSRTEYHPRDFTGVIPRTNAFNPFGVDVEVTWRIPDAERRRSLTEDDHGSAQVGARSPARARWKWEVAGTYSRDEFVDTTRGLYLASRVRTALASSNPLLALNPFAGANHRQSQTVLDNIATEAWFGGASDLLVFDARLSGPVLRLPAGPIQGAVFAEHRRERFSAVSDVASRTGDIVGFGQTGADASFAREVTAFGAEAHAPLLAAAGNTRGPRLAVEAAARAEEFAGGFRSGVKPSIGLLARPISDFTLRISHAWTFRAPSLPQLFLPQTDTFFNSVPDPRRPPALTGDDADGPNVPRLVRQGGNPRLAPETGRTLQTGLIWSPRKLAGFSFEATWFRYELEDLISGVSPTYVLDQELGGLGALVHRQPGSESFVNRTPAPIAVLTGPFGQKTSVIPGQSVSVPGRLARVDVFTVNLSRRRMVGWDFGARHEGVLAGGRWRASGAVSYTDEFSSAYDAQSPLVNKAGIPHNPRWRGRGSVDWARGSWSFGATMNYTARSGHHDVWSNYQKPYRVVHLRTTYTPPRQSWLRGTQINVGIEDLFDEQPPLNLDHPIGYNYASIPRPQGRFWRVTLRRTW